MLKATELEGVDPTKIVAMGSSIGADGAPDGCAWGTSRSLAPARARSRSRPAVSWISPIP